MILFIKTVRTYIFWFIISFVFTLICIPFALLPEKIRYDNRLYYFLTYVWTKLLIFFAFIFVRVKGEENLPKYPDSPSIIVMNHTSALDIFILETLIGSYPHIWMSKDSFGKIPLFSILLKRMHVLVKREDPRRAIRALYKAYDLARGGIRHLLLFPEGKRYDDGKIHDFFSGFAVLAKKLNRPVIPVLISGAEKILPAGRWTIDSRASDVKIVIGKPFALEKEETEKDFTNRVRNWFVENKECTF